MEFRRGDAGSKEKVALINEPLLAFLAIQLNAGPLFFLGGGVHDSRP